MIDAGNSSIIDTLFLDLLVVILPFSRILRRRPGWLQRMASNECLYNAAEFWMETQGICYL
jgi:hypothetical protein